MKRNRKRNLRNRKAKGSRYQTKQSSGFEYERLEIRQVLTAGTGFDTIGATSTDPAITSVLANNEGDVGPNHFVEVGDQTFTVFDRAGLIVESTSLNQFFIDAGGELFGENVVSPRVIFDRATDRWIIAAIGDNSGPLAGNFIHVAISETSDPTGQFQQTEFIATDDATLLSAELSLGVDDAGVYLATRNVELDQLNQVDVIPQSVSVFSIPKIDLFGPGVPSALNLTEFADLDPATYGQRIQFASNFDPLGDGVVYAFSEQSAQALNVFTISNAGETTPQAAIQSEVSLVVVDSTVLDPPGNTFNPNITAPVPFADPLPVLQPSVNVNGQAVGEELVVPNLSLIHI